MKNFIKFTAVIFIMLVSCTSFAQNVMKASVSISSNYAWAAPGCYWTAWSYLSYGKQRNLFCDNVRVAVAFQNQSSPTTSCSISIIANGYSSAATPSCYREIWLGQYPVTNLLNVRRYHTAPALSDADADAILLRASETLQFSQGADDVTCNVILARNGAVTTFANGDGVIDSSSEMNALSDGVNLVRAINYCGGLSPNIIGCAHTPGSKIAVVDFAYLNGILWAHEYGHNQGLQHRDDENAVMNSVIGASRERVNSAECNAFR